MSKLTSCKACKHEISRNAKNCPQCGEPVSRTSPLTWLLGAMALAGIMSAILRDNTPPNAAPDTRTPEQVAADNTLKKEQAQRYALAQRLGASIRQAAHDPDSIKWGTMLTDRAAQLGCLEYRAKNAFGALIMQRVVVVGEKISTDDETWNARCAGKTLFEVTGALPR